MFQVHLQAIHPVNGLRRLLDGFSERNPHPGQELSDPERLGDVIIGPGIQGLHFVIFPVPDGQDDHRHLGPFPQSAEHFDPIHIG